MVKLIYYSTLYKRTSTVLTDKVDFKDGRAEFTHMGHRYSVEMQYIIRIMIA